MSVARELAKTGTITDPGRKKSLETRQAVIADWMQTAAIGMQGTVHNRPSAECHDLCSGQ
jgi:hypothetical protein